MANGVKHVALHQLNIIKNYIDKKIETLLTTLIDSDAGIHGLRYKDGKLQHQNTDGTWADIVSANSGGSSDGTGSGLDLEDVATDEEVKAIFGL